MLFREKTYIAEKNLYRLIWIFIRQVAGRHIGRVLEWGRDEELSVALVAFNSAIDIFEYQRGNNFMSFAAMIFKRRLIDLHRSRSRWISKESLVGEMIVEISDEKLASCGYIDKMLIQERKWEITEFTKALKTWDITVEVVKKFP